MPDYVYLNDKVVPSSEARVSVFDHGFLYGDGLFETMRAHGTMVHLLEEHLNRLFRSAVTMKMELPWSRQELKFAITALLEANNLGEAAVRLTVTRGEGLPVPDPASCTKPTLVITCRPAPKLKGEIYQNGVDVVILETRRNYDAAFPVAVKSCNFLNNIFARQELREKGAYEGLMLNYKGHLTEGTVNNLFFVSKGKLLTPSMECGILDGIIRGEVIKRASEINVEVVEGAFTAEAMMSAEEAFLTNSVSLAVPIRSINGRVIPEVPGPLTSRISEAVIGSLAL